MRQFRLIRGVQLGIKNLMLHALRSLLTVLGLVFGVGSVIAMLSVGEGASQQALDQIRKLGSNNIILSSKKLVAEEASGARPAMMSIYGLTYDDDARLRESLPTVQETVPAKVVRLEGRLGERALELRVVGTTPDWFELVSRPVLAGRVLSNGDYDSNAGVCVLTETGARKLTATEHVVGQPISIGGNVFKIIGIVVNEKGSSSIPIPDQDVDAYIPLSTARERYGDHISRRTEGAMLREYVELHLILVQVDNTDDVEATAGAIDLMLKRFHKKEDYDISVPLALLKQAEATKRTFNIVLGSIAGISLVVGGIGIMNIMLATVTERTREIGIRRAIGAKQRQIISQFLIETVVLSSIGGVLGIGLGVVLPWAITHATKMPTIITMWSILLSLGISVAVGIVFGLYPAFRASRLDPIEALRHE
jgi:putative ABC transport system permease protein